MQKLKGGDGYFDIRMSRDERDIILLALESALANIATFNDPFDPIHPKDFEIALEIFRNSRHIEENQTIVRQLLFPYMDTEVILKRMVNFLKLKQIVVLELSIDHLQNATIAYSKILPSGDVPPNLYPKEYREASSAYNKQKHG